MSAISVRGLRYRFPGGERDALTGIDWDIGEGEYVLVAGGSGAGKSTLLRCLNGLIPHFHGGRFGGRVLVNGFDTRSTAPRDLARHVGAVFQDPESQIITGAVEDEIAFGLENLGVPRDEIANRVDRVISALGIEHLRDRETSMLSGGERQIVAIAAALAPEPDILALDEPTSQLDPQASHRVLDTLRQLITAGDFSVVIAEHRIRRLLPHISGIALLTADGFRSGRASTMEAELVTCGLLPPEQGPPASESSAPGDVIVEILGVSFAYQGHTVLDGIAVTVREGEVVALMGPNGSGKTTLLKQLIGLLRPASGTVLVAGNDISKLSVQEIARCAGYVPQNPTAILHRETLAGELAFTARAQRVAIDVDEVLGSLGIEAYRDSHPLDLSGGERQRAAIAAVAAAKPRLLLLDEPTRGLPWSEKERLGRIVQDYASQGRAVLIATHDADFALSCTSRVLLLERGRLVNDGPPHRVLAGSEAMADEPRAPVLTRDRAG